MIKFDILLIFMIYWPPDFYYLICIVVLMLSSLYRFQLLTFYSQPLLYENSISSPFSNLFLLIILIFFSSSLLTLFLLHSPLLKSHFFTSSLYLLLSLLAPFFSPLSSSLLISSLSNYLFIIFFLLNCSDDLKDELISYWNQLTQGPLYILSDSQLESQKENQLRELKKNRRAGGSSYQTACSLIFSQSLCHTIIRHLIYAIFL